MNENKLGKGFDSVEVQDGLGNYVPERINQENERPLGENEYKIIMLENRKRELEIEIEEIKEQINNIIANN